MTGRPMLACFFLRTDPDFDIIFSKIRNNRQAAVGRRNYFLAGVALYVPAF